jgi:hypothetical protein
MDSKEEISAVGELVANGIQKISLKNWKKITS